MKNLIFTLTLSIIIHILILVSFSKYSNAKTYNNIAVTSENYVEVSIVKPANDGIKNATDFTGSDKISQKNVKSNKNENNKQGLLGKKNKKEKNQQSIAKSAKAGSDGYNKISYTQGFASYIPRPKYPLSSRRNKEEGTVVFKISLNSKGDMINYKIIKSSGYKKLDKQAEISVKSAKFQPALNNGKPVSSDFELKITFSLKDR